MYAFTVCTVSVFVARPCHCVIEKKKTYAVCIAQTAKEKKHKIRYKKQPSGRTFWRMASHISSLMKVKFHLQ